MDSELILELPSDIRAIEAAVDHVIRRCSDCRTHARRLRLNLRVSLTEALSNAMLSGNAADPAKRVRVEVRRTAAAITAWAMVKVAG